MSADSFAVPARVSARGAAPTRRIDWLNVIGISLYHLVALFALLPWLFSWTGVALFVAGLYVFGTIGINMGYHRLLTHRGFACPKWLEHVLVILAVCSFQDTPAHWVAVHRRHHEHADEEPDPHSPIVSFLWAHVGWLLVIGDEMERMHIYSRYARDIVRDPLYRRLDKLPIYGLVILASWVVFFVAGLLIAAATGAGPVGALQFGLSLLVWGVFLRTVAVWHITWSVNSVTHIWGYRNYETDEHSTNNLVVALLTSGEGWHNNHHADPRSARHGHRWWEFDLVYWAIRLLGIIGLARDIAEPNEHRLASKKLVTRTPAETD
jgi:fatty-acid desaturase